ncbi:MAG TPA: hypothetical protein VIR58_07515 [Acidimicrobiales bacterium]
MTEPAPSAPVHSQTPTPTPTIMELLSERVGMTEGQLYTAVIAIAVAVLLTVTGVPNARQRSDTDGFSGSGSVPTLPATTTPPPAQEAP